ncbi:MAG: peptidoglycan DD-metalloendopeptidase family protein [Nitriliruptorales bacterium]|nr:peptidoglycan DD-metalloendopeptidase family protein [Nitriliruptorales bacterium]
MVAFLRAVLTAAVTLVTVLAVAAPVGADNRSALERAKQQIAEVTREIEAAEDRAARAATEAAQARARLERVEEAVNQAAQAVARQRRAVGQAERDLVRLEQDHLVLRAVLDRRAAQLYKGGGQHPLESVLTASDLGAALERSAYLRALSASDRAALEEFAASQVAVAVQQERFAVELDQLEEIEAEQRELLAQVEALTASKTLAAAAAAERVRTLESQKDDLEEDAAALEDLISRTRVTAPRTVAPSPGGYQWPRCDNVTSEYGYRWGRLHAGLDIDGDHGSPIFAAKGGVVIFAGWQGGYGKLTLIDHGDGVVTAYAHQTSQYVSQGQSVGRGEQIGTVGTTGSSTGSHLHFETRVHGGAVNPRRFLPSSC